MLVDGLGKAFALALPPSLAFAVRTLERMEQTVLEQLQVLQEQWMVLT
jgi:hypothetical protein